MATDLPVMGWREWIALPDLDIPWIKAKVDTGARSSALHAEDIQIRKHGRVHVVEFVVYPEQRTSAGSKRCRARLLDVRQVTSSNGRREERPIIHTACVIGSDAYDIDLSLTSRGAMGFRMLLGRQAIRNHFAVDPGRSFLTRKRKRKKKRA
jgi:hypothetical protein